jgi:MerR family transcriptional regulator/heat shock protein HspR
MDRPPGNANQAEYVRIEVAARLVGLQPTRVRRYIESGLVSSTRDERGRPLLGADELARLRKIRRLTNEIGLNLVGVEIVLRLLDDMEAIRAGRNTTPLVRNLLGPGELPRSRRT